MKATKRNPNTAQSYIFRSKSAGNASSNFKELKLFLLTHCDLFNFELGTRFQANRWDFSSVLEIKSRFSVVHFSPNNEKEPFCQPFLDQAKCLVASYYMDRKLKSGYGTVKTVLSCWYKALQHAGKPLDITELDGQICDLAMSYVSEIKRSQVGSIAKVLIEEHLKKHDLTKCRLAWRPPKKTNKHYNSNLVGSEQNSKIGLSRLPDFRMILDLAKVFQNPQSPRDVQTTAWFALSLFAPTRVNEIMDLPVCCETESDIDGERTYGLMWSGSKGAAEHTKWALSSEWELIAHEAIVRLREMGAHTRVVAAWYEANNSLYLPSAYTHRRGDYFLLDEVYQVLGIQVEGEGQALEKAKRAKLAQFGIRPCAYITKSPELEGWIMRGGRIEDVPVDLVQILLDEHVTIGRRKMYWPLYSFKSVEQYAFSKLPKNFPFVDSDRKLKCSEALFIYPLGSLSETFVTVGNMFEFGNIGKLGHDLKPGSVSTPSIFERHGLKNPDTAEFWSMTTNQPRHLLNTLAQYKYLNQLLIAHWSGRENVEHNVWYNHLPQEVVIEAYRAMGETSPVQLNIHGPLEEKVREICLTELISYEEALKCELGSIHITRYGLCRHDYSLTPCPKDKDCVNCGENLFVKGDDKQIDEARTMIKLHGAAVSACEKAIADDEPSVDRWLEIHEKKKQRWELAYSKLTDPQLTDGTLISLPPPEHSQAKSELILAVADLAENS